MPIRYAIWEAHRVSTTIELAQSVITSQSISFPFRHSDGRRWLQCHATRQPRYVRTYKVLQLPPAHRYISIRDATHRYISIWDATLWYIPMRDATPRYMLIQQPTWKAHRVSIPIQLAQRVITSQSISFPFRHSGGRRWLRCHATIQPRYERTYLKTITANGTSVCPDTGGYTPVHPDTVRYVRSSPCEYNNPTCPASHHILVHLLSLSTLWWSPLALMPRYVKTYVMPTTATSTPVHLDTGRYTPVHPDTGCYTLVHADTRGVHQHLPHANLWYFQSGKLLLNAEPFP